MDTHLILGVTAAAMLLSVSAQADIEISKRPTQNMNCNAGLCTPTAKDAVLNVTDLTNMLAGGDLTVQSGNGDGTAAGIEIDDSFSWTSTSRLTLDVKKSIVVKAPVTVAGTGALTLTCAEGNPAGDLLFEKKGKIDFWDTSSNLTVNGTSYTLLKDVKMLAKDIAVAPSGAYALAADAVASTYNRSPVSGELTGTFEGLGHQLSGLGINAVKGQCLGLFESSSGTVRDIALTNVAISKWNTHKSEIGSVVGCNYGTVVNVYADGEIASATSHAGGLVGENHGSVLRSNANVIVGASGAGGAVGKNFGTVERVSSTGPVTGFYAGGLVSTNETGGKILLSRATGTVSAKFDDYYCGGLVGWNLGGAQIDQSFATGAVYAGCAGGLVGGCAPEQYGTGSISNSYASGSVQGPSSSGLGGMAGVNRGGSIVSSYSVGAVGSGGDTGGFIGINDDTGELAHDYWDIDTSGETKPCGTGRCTGVMGLSDAQLKSGLPDGFDPQIWGQSPSINNGYPYLLANPPPQ